MPSEPRIYHYAGLTTFPKSVSHRQHFDFSTVGETAWVLREEPTVEPIALP